MEGVLSSHPVRRTLVEWLYVLNHCHGQYPDLPLTHGAKDLEGNYGYGYFFKRSTILARRAKKALFSFLHSQKLYGMHEELIPRLFPEATPELIADLSNEKYVKELHALYNSSTVAMADPTNSTVDKLSSNPEIFGKNRALWTALHKIGNVYYGWLPAGILESWSWALCWGVAAGRFNARLAEVSTAKLDGELMMRLSRGHTPSVAETNSLFATLFTKEQFEWIKAMPADELNDDAQEATTNPQVNATIEKIEETRWVGVDVIPAAKPIPALPASAPVAAPRPPALVVATPAPAPEPIPTPPIVQQKPKEDVVMVRPAELDPKLAAALAKTSGAAADCGSYPTNGGGRFIQPSEYLHSAVVNAILGGLGQIEMVLEKKRDLKRLEALSKIRRDLMNLMS